MLQQHRRALWTFLFYGYQDQRTWDPPSSIICYYQNPDQQGNVLENMLNPGLCSLALSGFWDLAFIRQKVKVRRRSNSLGRRPGKVAYSNLNRGQSAHRASPEDQRKGLHVLAWWSWLCSRWDLMAPDSLLSPFILPLIFIKLKWFN